MKSTGGFGGWGALASEPASQQSFYPFSPEKGRLVVADETMPRSLGVVGWGFQKSSLRQSYPENNGTLLSLVFLHLVH